MWREGLRHCKTERQGAIPSMWVSDSGKPLLEADMLEGNVRSGVSSVAYCKIEYSKILKINLACVCVGEALIVHSNLSTSTSLTAFSLSEGILYSWIEKVLDWEFEKVKDNK